MKTKMKKLIIFLFLATMVGFAFKAALITSASEPCTVEHFYTDTITKGDWFFNPQGSPIGIYGSYAHILPNVPQPRLEVPIGEYTVPVGSYSAPPYNWTSSQIAGLAHYKPNPPYWDEYVSQVPPVTYYVNGTEYCPSLRELLNVEGETTYRRAACWFAGSGSSPSEITMTLNLEAGSYLLSLYILDYDTTARRQVITVSSGTATDNHNVNKSFNSGLYENFFVHLSSSGAVTVTIANYEGGNAVVSGVFLGTTSEMPATPTEDEISYLGEDSTTHGNWMGTYGDIGYIKCAWNVPEINTPYWSWNINYDGYSNVDYTVIASQYAWTIKTEWVEGGCIQYPVFEWAWAGWHGSQTDPREVYYTTSIEGTGNGPGWRLATWDDGGERCQPKHGYMDFHLTFPEGTYLLSLYAYDYERNQRDSQEYQIWDETGTTLLASKQISGTAFDEGVYEIFKVVAPPEDCTIIVRVYNDAGHPTPTINLVLSGIFVDKVEEVCGLTIGFWKTNAAKDLELKRGKAQVGYNDYLELLACVNGYGGEIGDWTSWNITGTRDGLEWALHWLSYGAYKPGEGWTNPEASDPQVKARAQLLALLLTACYKGSVYTSADLSVPGYNGLKTISDWIEYIIAHYNNDHYKIVYEIANYLNENCTDSVIY